MLSKAMGALDCSFRTVTELPSNGRVTLRHMINPVDETITVELTYLGQGWLSLGFSNTGMIDATTVVGLPDEEIVEKYYMEGKIASLVNPTDRNPTLTNTSIVQTETETILTYTKPLVESGELSVQPNESNTIIWAVGSGNAWGTPHILYSPFTLTFDTCTDTEVEEPTTDVEDPTATEDLDCTLYSTLEILPGLLTLREVTNPTDKTVTMELTYAGQGWVSLAFSSNGFMVGTTAVVGLPDSNTVVKYFLGGKSFSSIQLSDDDKQTLTDTMIMQNDTHTVLRFTKLLEEPGELAVSADGNNKVIFATGTGNSFSSFHDNIGAFDLTLTPCIVAGTVPTDTEKGTADLFNDEFPNESLWKVHGYLMAFAWGLFVPLAIGVSLARNLLPDGMWFVLHRGLNAAALLYNIVAIAIAIYLINDSTAPGQSPKHFQENNHRTIGLVVFLLAFVQAMVAIFRPSHHHAKPDDVEKEGDAQATGETTGASHENEGKPFVRTLWEIKHRVVGAGLIALSWYNVHTGIDLFEERFGENGADANLVFWVIVGVLTALVGAATILSKSRSS